MEDNSEKNKLHIELIKCKSALNGRGSDYTLNPYVGCEHGCCYCYASYICRWKNIGHWGSWIEVKRNISFVLQKEMNKKRGITIFFSTVCDAYQPLEGQYGITRECLEILQRCSVFDQSLRILLLTKSDLIQRDIDILSNFPDNCLEVGFSVCLFNDEIASIFEPRAPAPSRRFAAARKLKNAGVKTGILINPILPYFTERELKRLIEAAEMMHLDFVGFDMLNYINSHVGKKLRPLYASFGEVAKRSFIKACIDPLYKRNIKEMLCQLTLGKKIECRL